jgi:hypothetical protein
VTEEEGIRNAKIGLGGVEIIEVMCPVCPVCNTRSFMTVDKEGYDKYLSGEFIQVAFPKMSADYREMMVTGIHPKCWEDHIAPLAEDWEG